MNFKPEKNINSLLLLKLYKKTFSKQIIVKNNNDYFTYGSLQCIVNVVVKTSKSAIDFFEG